MLGFSARDVLARITGEYALDMVWADRCRDCEDAAPAFTGSETEVRIAISSTATTARVEECYSRCRVTTMFVPVEGVLTTTDGLLDEAFELELMTQALDGVGIGDRLAAADLTGSLPVEVPHLDLVEWSFFGVTETVAAFEVFVVTNDSNRLVNQPTEGGRNPEGQSWGVEFDLDQVRQ